MIAAQVCGFRYDLKDNDIILADWKKHGDLIEDMKALGPVEYSAGGAGLNSLRCAQVIIGKIYGQENYDLIFYLL